MPYEASAKPDVQPSVDVPLAITPQALGAGVGDAVQHLGETATDIHLAEIDHANRTAVLDADNQQQAFIQARMHDPKTGILNQPLGKNAPAAVDQALAEYDQSASRVAAGLTNEAQKAHFAQMAFERRAQMHEQLSRYEHAETERYADEVAKGSIINATNNAVQFADEPEAVAGSVELIHAILDEQGKAKGRSPELTAALKQEAASGVYTAVIGSLADQGDATAAQAAFTAWGEDLTADDKRQVRGWLKTTVTRSESRETADAVLAKIGPDGDLQSAIENLEARKIANTDVYDQARHRLEEHFDLVNKAETQRQAGLYDDAATRIDAAANPLSPDTIPPTAWAAMKPAYRRKAMAYAKAVAAGQDLVTPKELFAALEQEKAQDPIAFSKRNLVTLPLSKADFRASSTDQAAIAKGDAKLVAKFQTDGAIVNQMLVQGGIKPAKTGVKQSEDEVAFRDQLAKAVTAEQQATGKEIGQDRLQAIGRELMQAQVLQRANGSTTFLSKIDDLLPFGFLLPERAATDSYDHAFQSPIAAAYAYSPAQVPKEAAAKHRAALARAGFKPAAISDEMVQQAYNESLVETYRRGE